MAQQSDVYANQISTWLKQLLACAAGVFGSEGGGDGEPAVKAKQLHTKIGELALENDFWAGALGQADLL